MPKIDQSMIETAPIPLPPFAEQQRIVAEVERRLSVVDELESVVNANLQRAARLRQSILQEAFEGKLLISELNRLVPVSEELPVAAEPAAKYRSKVTTK